MEFTKMHGAGNDFVLIRDEHTEREDYSEIASKMCHRHFGIGADGLMIVKQSDVADIRMIYYNSDGSLAEMCGNGIRCFSNYVYENQWVSSNPFTVETMAGIKRINVGSGAPNQRLIGVHMGAVKELAKDVPVVADTSYFRNVKMQVGHQTLTLSAIRLGVPHTVAIIPSLEAFDVVDAGSRIEKMDIFPENTNVNFVEVVSNDHLKVDTWERGAGHTLACGTGVCSAVFIAHRNGYVGDCVKVDVPGGRLQITLLDDGVYMEGQAVFICNGTYFEEVDTK